MKRLFFVLIGLVLVSSLSLARPLNYPEIQDYREVKLMGRVLKLNLTDCKNDLFTTENQKFWRCKIKVDSDYISYSEALHTTNHFEEKYTCGRGRSCIISAYLYPELVTISVRPLHWWSTDNLGDQLLKEDALVGLTNFMYEYGQRE